LIKPIYNDEFDPEVLFITHGTKVVLDFCDGNNTAEYISRNIEKQLDLEGADEDIYNVLNRLLASDCIEVATNEVSASVTTPSFRGTPAQQDWNR
jgi:hypothetical protein